MKVAYFCEPQLGGTFTFFKRLRPALAAHGIDFRCVAPLPAARLKGTRFEGADGVEAMDLSDALPEATGQLIAHLQREAYDLAMVLPAADLLSSNMPAYLPRAIRCVMRVPMMTRGAYAPARAVAPHLDRIYAVSDRIRDDLTGPYRVPAAQVEVVYHGVDPAPFPDTLEHKSSSGPVRLLYAGRLWDVDKGVFLLPVMLKRLRADGVEVHLTVAGDGPDAAALERRFREAGVMDRVTLAGGLPLERMNAQYRDADVFVFPSRFEGCGFAVLEAMAASCAPVVSDIRGSLRVLVDDGRCGQLARVGDGVDFARAVRELAQDRARLAQVQQAARRRVLERFTIARMAADYAASFRRVLASPDTRAPVRPLSDYEIPRAMLPTWRTWIPRPIKNAARAWLERMGRSS